MAKGKVELKKDICKACELCASVCPKNCLELDRTAVNVKGYHPITMARPEDCIGCASCAIICPDCVISVYVE